MTPEWLGVGVPLAIVVVLLLRSKSDPRLTWFTCLCLLTLVTASAWAWNLHIVHRTASDEQLAQSVPAIGRPGGYVSSDKCQACHPNQYASWHQTYHRTMTQIASPSAIVARFDNQKLELDGKAYLLQRRGEEFWVEMEDPEWQPAAAALFAAETKRPVTAPRVWKRIGLLTGSHHMQVFWVAAHEGNGQFVFPFAWLNEDQRWVPFHTTFLRDPAKGPTDQTWNLNCIKCHATGGQPQLDPHTSVLSTRAGELGIACEACHGPGDAHVRANQNPVRRYLAHREGKADGTIVNPKRLSPRLSSEVCGQCHGIRWIPAAERFRQDGFSFRPGEELDRSTPLVRPAHLQTQPWLREPLQRDPTFLEEHYWPDGAVRVSGRDFNGMVEAPCFQRGNLSCVSCHSLHESNPNNQLAAGMETNEACLQCHTAMRGKIQEHTHHLVKSSGSDCYNCHMPHTVYGLLKAIRSHQIDSPKVQTTIDTGRPNACNLCHLDRSLGWTAQYLTQWYGQPAPKLSEQQQSISAAVDLALEGDAGQRALIAWSMGWGPAQQASGRQWLPPYLAVLLEDNYSAVRYVAGRALSTLGPEYQQLHYDFIAPPAERVRMAKSVLERWTELASGKLDRSGPELFLSASARLDEEKIRALLQQRNNRSMDLEE